MSATVLPTHSKAPGARRAAEPRALMTGKPKPPGTYSLVCPSCFQDVFYARQIGPVKFSLEGRLRLDGYPPLG